MDRLNKPQGIPNQAARPSGSVFRMARLVYVTIACLVGALSLHALAAAEVTPETAAGKPSIHHQPRQTLTVQDRKDQWFFAEAVAQSLWELAMYAERLTLHSRADRVETLQGIYAALMAIEGELALKRQNLVEQHAMTEALMSHPDDALTADQQRAFDAYMLEIVALHQSAAVVIDQDAFLKKYYGHLLAINGMTVFLERLQEFLRAKQPQLGDRLDY
jgi:hypothetical protein